jgi:hypothetical protein
MARNRRDRSETLSAERRTDMNINTNPLRLNWIVTVVAVALAAVAGGSPLFG